MSTKNQQVRDAHRRSMREERERMAAEEAKFQEGCDAARRIAPIGETKHNPIDEERMQALLVRMDALRDEVRSALSRVGTRALLHCAAGGIDIKDLCKQALILRRVDPFGLPTATQYEAVMKWSKT